MGVKGESRTVITIIHTVLVDQRETSDEEDESPQQPQVVQTVQKGETRGSGLQKPSRVQGSNTHCVDRQDHNNQRVIP